MGWGWVGLLARGRLRSGLDAILTTQSTPSFERIAFNILANLTPNWSPASETLTAQSIFSWEMVTCCDWLVCPYMDKRSRNKRSSRVIWQQAEPSPKERQEKLPTRETDQHIHPKKPTQHLYLFLLIAHAKPINKHIHGNQLNTCNRFY